MSEQVDCAVIGAGVVGLAIARRMAMAGRVVVLLEAEQALGTHTSARNSDVIHTGIYSTSDVSELVDLSGIESPGLTPSLTVADHVAATLE